MQFATYIRDFCIVAGGTGEFHLVCVISLVLFSLGMYLLLRRGTIWHTMAGVVISTMAVVYVLMIGGFIPMAPVVGRRLIDEGLRLIGLA